MTGHAEFTNTNTGRRCSLRRLNGDDWDDCFDSMAGCWNGWVAGCHEWCIPHCFDRWQHGDEAAVDCGGSCEAKCAPGQGCRGGWDCSSGVCIEGACR